MDCRGELKCHGVYGNGRCDICGFNPAEKERRFRDGRFENIYVRHVLHDDYGKVIHVQKGLCKTLVFKKGV